MNSDPDAVANAVLGRFAAGREALAAGVRLEALAGGLDNQSWRVTSAVGDWVVRRAGSRDQRFGINRVAERQAQAAAAALGLAPPIVYAEPDRGILVSERVAGQVWTRADARSAAGIQALGARLGQMHAASPPRAVRRVNVHDVLAHYLELRGVPPGPVARQDVGARLRWALATYRPAPPALCHNDLHHLNMIGDAPLMFVDWEYAGVGDPTFEVAAVVGYHDYDAEQRHALLVAHGGDFKPVHVTQMCLVFDCLHALWLDAAGGWDALSPERREALIARLTVDPTIRPR
jgi:thiamine kinase